MLAIAIPFQFLSCFCLRSLDAQLKHCSTHTEKRSARTNIFFISSSLFPAPCWCSSPSHFGREEVVVKEEEEDENEKLLSCFLKL
jgi:hypothetical protein